MSSLSGSVVRLQLRVFVGSHLRLSSLGTHRPGERLRKKTSPAPPGLRLVGPGGASSGGGRLAAVRSPRIDAVASAWCPLSVGRRVEAPREWGAQRPRRAWRRKDVVRPASVVSAVSAVSLELPPRGLLPRPSGVRPGIPTSPRFWDPRLSSSPRGIGCRACGPVSVGL